MNLSIKLIGGFIARTSLVLVLLVAGWLLQTPSVQAAGPTCTVGASGATYTTIQAAVNDSGCATINVAAGTYTENVTIGRSVTINGSTTGSTIVDGHNAGAVFQNTGSQYTGKAVTLANLTIQHGSGVNSGNGITLGGGIANNGTLTLNNSTISSNNATANGGGIYNTGTLTVSNSTINGNSTTYDGGGIYTSRTLVVSNSTINGNSAGSHGGGVFNWGTLVMSNSTLSGNRSPVSGGIFNSSSLSVNNSILANSVSGGDCFNGGTTTGHNNLIQDARNACGLTNSTNGNIIGQDPKLSALQNNGGATATMALLAGSPAIDAGDDTVCSATPVSSLDQRGIARPQGAHCDIGAYEATATVPPVVTVSFTPNGQNGWFVTNPTVGSVTAQGLTSITNIRCNNARVNNLIGLGTANASATVSVTAEGALTIVTCTATDSAGQSGAAAGSSNRAEIWLDSLAPDTTITAQPANPASSTAASFSFTGADTGSPVVGYQCQLDGGAFVACTSPTLYNALSAGQHTFQVRAIDMAGNVDATPATYTWTISVPTATPTNTPVPPTATPTMTPTPTATNTPVPPTATPTATATNTPLPPTATPTNTQTNTPVPPTATPTATATNTPVPPTATPTNTPAVPVANNDNYATNEDTPLTIAAPGVLSNDTDADSPALTAVLVSNPANGSLTLNPDGAFVYTPNADFNGSDSFTYQVNDGLNISNVATVSLTVNAVNDAPVATNDSYTVTQDTPLLIPAPGLLSNDGDREGDALTVNLVSNPANGSVTLNANGAFSYLPNNGFVGSDSFTYQVSDGQATSNVATVSITIMPGNGTQSPVGITGGSGVETIGAPCSVAPNVLENDSQMRIFPERLAYRLPSAVTVTAPNGSKQTLAQGTLVDSYYLHADWVNGGQNVAKLFQGNVSFSQAVLGIITSSDGLLATNGTLGDPGTTYATSTDQGLESYDDKAWFSNGGQTLQLWLNVYSTSDAVRILTPARQGLTLGGAVEGIGSPCSVVEGKLESDSALRFFPERLNAVLPTPLIVDGYGADGVGTRGMVLPQGARVNVYYVHADLVGDGQGKQLRGTVTFDTPILAVLVDGASLNNTHTTLGATWHPTVKTAYSARGDQGLEAGDQISVQQNRVDFTLSSNADTDQLRIITAAPGSAPGGSATVSAATATDSAADASLVLPADAVAVFPLAGDSSDAGAPLDHNDDATTGQFTNRLYLPLVSR